MNSKNNTLSFINFKAAKVLDNRHECRDIPCPVSPLDGKAGKVGVVDVVRVVGEVAVGC